MAKHRAPVDPDDSTNETNNANANTTSDNTGQGDDVTQAGSSSSTPVESALAELLPRISIVAGNPNAVEVAAVTAVLAAVLEELRGVADVPVPASRSMWERGSSSLRQPIRPGAGAWRAFSG
ncbi:MAG: acyl-CoA carboxylase subunit epsilon [Glaciihabitans sp.]|nr:acyl-CoA carboxylase subunit epsilon [Glaciihabitans sp.]